MPLMGYISCLNLWTSLQSNKNKSKWKEHKRNKDVSTICRPGRVAFEDVWSSHFLWLDFGNTELYFASSVTNVWMSYSKQVSFQSFWYLVSKLLAQNIPFDVISLSLSGHTLHNFDIVDCITIPTPHVCRSLWSIRFWSGLLLRDSRTNSSHRQVINMWQLHGMCLDKFSWNNTAEEIQYDSFKILKANIHNYVPISFNVTCFLISKYIIIIYLSWSWATCWPVPVSRIQKSLQWSAMIPSASWRIVFHYPG